MRKFPPVSQLLEEELIEERTCYRESVIDELAQV